MNPRLVAALAGTFASLLPAQTGEPQHLLRVAWKPGDSQYYRKTMMTRMGPEESPTMTGTGELTLLSSVTEVREGKAQVQQIVKRMMQRMVGPGDHRMEYDSETGAGDPSAKAMTNQMLDRPVTLTVDERCRISKVEVGEDFANSPTQMVFMVTAVPLPEAPIAVGKTWEATAKMSIPELRDEETLLVSKLAGVTKGLATIETEVQIDPAKIKLPTGLEFRKYAITTVIDLASGRLIESRWDVRWQGNGPDGKKGERVLTMKVEPIQPPQAKEPDKPKQDQGGKL